MEKHLCVARILEYTIGLTVKLPHIILNTVHLHRTTVCVVIKQFSQHPKLQLQPVRLKNTHLLELSRQFLKSADIADICIC